MKRTLSLVIPAAFLLAAIGPGCYTILVHPTDEGGGRAAQSSECVRCHADYHQYPYGYYYSPYPSYWWEYPNYGHYYAYPWWWSFYHGEDQNNDGWEDDAGTGEERETKFDRRDTRSSPMPPPYYQGDNNVSWPARPGVIDRYDGSSGGSGSGTVTPSRPETGGETRTKDDSGETKAKDVRQGDQKSPTDTNEVKPQEPKKETPKSDAGKKKSKKERP